MSENSPNKEKEINDTEIESEEQNPKPEESIENDTDINKESEEAVKSENLEVIQEPEDPDIFENNIKKESESTGELEVSKVTEVIENPLTSDISESDVKKESEEPDESENLEGIENPSAPDNSESEIQKESEGTGDLENLEENENPPAPDISESNVKNESEGTGESENLEVIENLPDSNTTESEIQKESENADKPEDTEEIENPPASDITEPEIQKESEGAGKPEDTEVIENPPTLDITEPETQKEPESVDKPEDSKIIENLPAPDVSEFETQKESESTGKPEDSEIIENLPVPDVTESDVKKESEGIGESENLEVIHPASDTTESNIKQETKGTSGSENLEIIENLPVPEKPKIEDKPKIVYKSNDLNIEFDLENLLGILNFNVETFKNQSEDDLFAEYEKLLDENNCIALKNTDLHENLIEYLKSIKIDEGSLRDFENIHKVYIEDLCSYIEFHEGHYQDQSELRNNIAKLEETLKNSDEKNMNELQKFFDELTSNGENLSFPKTRKPLNEKVIMENFQRIESRLETLDLARQKCNDIKNSLEDKETLLKSLSTLDCGLTVQDYEKLESKSQYSVNKICEYKEQINVLQNEFFRKQHILAHIQERNCYLENLQSEKREELQKIDTLMKEAKLDLIILKKKKYNLKVNVETRSTKSKYLFDEKLLLDYKNNPTPIQESNDFKSEVQEVPKNTNLQTKKSEEKEKTSDEKVQIKPKFHRTANLKR